MTADAGNTYTARKRQLIESYCGIWQLWQSQPNANGFDIPEAQPAQPAQPAPAQVQSVVQDPVWSSDGTQSTNTDVPLASYPTIQSAQNSYYYQS